jgi:hypothetical protein
MSLRTALGTLALGLLAPVAQGPRPRAHAGVAATQMTMRDNDIVLVKIEPN